jgi:hypothetical protein
VSADYGLGSLDWTRDRDRRDGGTGWSWDGGTSRSGARGILFPNYNFLAVVVVRRGSAGVRVGVVMAGAVDGVEDAIGSFVKTVAE